MVEAERSQTSQHHVQWSIPRLAPPGLTVGILSSSGSMGLVTSVILNTLCILYRDGVYGLESMTNCTAFIVR